MKKIILIITILILVCGCSSALKSTKISDLEKKLQDKESFILCLSEEDEAGTTLRHTLESVSKDKKVYYINTYKLSSDDEDKLKELFTYENSNIILFIKNGEEVSTLSRITDTFISQDKLKDELKNQGY